MKNDLATIAALLRTRLPMLEGERIRVRQPDEADAADLLEIFGDLETLRYWSHGPMKDLDEMRSYIADMHRLREEGSLFQWVVELIETGKAIGTVTLSSLNVEHRRADTGFTLNQSLRGRGLAGEAVGRLLAFAFEDLGLHRIEADVDPENAASMRLLERLGFQREGFLRERWFTYGEWRDTVLFGLLRSDGRETT